MIKKALFVSYSFPPVNTPGGCRTAKFVKYLRPFDWQAIVITAKRKNGKGRPLDPSLLGDVPEGTTIIRVHSIEPLRLLFKLSGLLQKALRINWRRGAQGIQNKGDPRFPARSLLKKILRATLERPLSIPDQYIGWVPFALASALHAVRKQRPKVIFTSSPPLSCHLVGLVLKAVLGIPWVADFRDVWPSFFAQKKAPDERIQDHVGTSILRRADKVISVSDAIIGEFSKRHPALPRKKFKVITNGYDPDDFRDVPPLRFDRFTILHTGEIFNRDPSVVLDSLRDLASSGQIGKDLQLVFLGTLYKASITTDEVTRDLVKIIAPVPHREAISCMLGADVLLLLIGDREDHTITYPSKLFEYVFVNRPILAISSRGPVPELVKSAKLGFSYKPTEKDSVSQCILSLYSRWQAGTLVCLQDKSIMAGFHRKALTKQLAEVLNQVS